MGGFLFPYFIVLPPTKHYVYGLVPQLKFSLIKQLSIDTSSYTSHHDHHLSSDTRGVGVFFRDWGVRYSCESAVTRFYIEVVQTAYRFNIVLYRYIRFNV